jgi:hypothetical protein
MFLHGCAMLVSDNLVGQTCNTASNYLNKPMEYTEFVVNSNKHWRWTTLGFSSKHAQCFYNDLKFQNLD